MCCSPWGRKESNTTERLNWTELCNASIYHKHIIASSAYLDGKLVSFVFTGSILDISFCILTSFLDLKM